MYVFIAYIKMQEDFLQMKTLLQKNSWKQSWRYYLFTSWSSLLNHCKEHRTDLQLALIDMTDDTAAAIKQARELLKMEPNLRIIFSGPRGTDIQKLYAVEHLYFLYRPYCKEDLEAAMEKAIRSLGRNLSELLHVVNQKGIHTIKKDSITFLEKDKRMVHVHTLNGRCSFYGRFSDMEPYLDARFCQCHQSYIVNLYQVKELLQEAFILKTGERIPVTKKRRSEVWDHYERFIEIKPYWLK